METTRPSWGALADAVGYGVLVFAFLPALAPVPRWLAFELQNPLNRSDAIVLAFVPVRGGVLLLNAFYEGVVPGILTGILNTLLFATCATHTPSIGMSAPRAAAAGAATGTTAAAIMLLAVAAVHGSFPWSPTAAAFELASALVCGVVAARGVVKLLRGVTTLSDG